MTDAPRCPVHARPLLTYCPQCRGAAGGRAVELTEKRLAQLRAAAKQPRPSRRKER